uniref:Uncharacterized protein n=1 Tax=Arundo donax TaxID=35708 RepID=A0A0A9FCX2_ARUDO
MICIYIFNQLFKIYSKSAQVNARCADCKLLRLVLNSCMCTACHFQYITRKIIALHFCYHTYNHCTIHILSEALDF